MSDTVNSGSFVGTRSSSTLRTRHHGLAASFLLLLKAWRKRARDRADLARMDGLALRDIGADSATVALEVERPFWLAPLVAWRAASRARRGGRG